MTEMPQQAPMPAERVSVRPRTPIPPDTILIGKKPVMAYATAVMMHFSGGAKVVRRRFFEGKLSISGVTIGTEVLGEAGDMRNVSTIEIKVQKP